MEEKIKTLFSQLDDSMIEEIASQVLQADDDMQNRIIDFFSDSTGLKLEHMAKNTRKKKKITGWKRICAVAAILIIILAVGGTATYAAFKQMTISLVDYKSNHGIQAKVSATLAASDVKKKYYLHLDYIPEGYQWNEKDSLYRGKEDPDSLFWSVSLFHLQSDFKYIMANSKQAEQMESDVGEAYYLESPKLNRLYIRFDQADYMMEVIVYNHSISKKEVERIARGASITTTPETLAYEPVEWTKEKEKSYEDWLDRVTATESEKDQAVQRAKDQSIWNKIALHNYYGISGIRYYEEGDIFQQDGYTFQILKTKITKKADDAWDGKFKELKKKQSYYVARLKISCDRKEKKSDEKIWLNSIFLHTYDAEGKSIEGYEVVASDIGNDFSRSDYFAYPLKKGEEIIVNLVYKVKDRDFEKPNYHLLDINMMGCTPRDANDFCLVKLESN